MDILPPRRGTVGARKVEPISRSIGQQGRDETRRDGSTPARLPVALETRETRGGHGPLQRASAPLMAQMIASNMGLPQTRRLRRASHEVARSAYGNAQALKEAPRPGRSTLA